MSIFTAKADRNRLLAEKTVKSLKERNFDAYYTENKSEALELALSLIDKNDTVSFGGSLTMDELGIVEKLYERGNPVIDRNKAETREESLEIMRQGLLSDTFIMSSNAISSDGILYNIDGTGNRIAALIYGPKSVIVLAGVNKITADKESAHHRARNIAAPTNSQRFDFENPCKRDGLCHDCKSPTCICSHIVETRMCKPAGRIKVIIIGEELGM